MNAMPIFTYVDELLSGLWITWCKEILRNEGTKKFLTPRGFQEKQGTTGANVRSRALEAYHLGLLKAPVVNSRGSSSLDIPSGWSMTYSEGVITRLGHICYAIGEGLVLLKHGDPISKILIQDALSVIYAIMLLQIRFDDGRGNNVLTVALFRHILSSYPKPPSIPESTWNRYVSAALFCSLENEGAAVIDSYLAGSPFTDLAMVSEGNVRKNASPAALEKMIKSDYSLTSIIKTKTSLFFIGQHEDANPRGIYTGAVRKCDELLEIACTIERKSITNEVDSPFHFWILDEDKGKTCVLDKLNKAFLNEGNEQWRRSMVTLKNGVIEALRFIGDEGEALSPKSFYVHGNDLHVNGGDVVVEVPEASCDPRMASGSCLLVGKAVYEVKLIEVKEGIKRITARSCEYPPASNGKQGDH